MEPRQSLAPPARRNTPGLLFFALRQQAAVHVSWARGSSNTAHAVCLALPVVASCALRVLHCATVAPEPWLTRPRGAHRRESPHRRSRFPFRVPALTYASSRWTLAQRERSLGSHTGPWRPSSAGAPAIRPSALPGRCSLSRDGRGSQQHARLHAARPAGAAAVHWQLLLWAHRLPSLRRTRGAAASAFPGELHGTTTRGWPPRGCRSLPGASCCLNGP